MSQLTQIITATDPAIRNRSLDAFCRVASLNELLAECEALDQLRRSSDNLYERVRALFFLYAIHRFHLPLKPGVQRKGLIPFEGYSNLLKRRFEEAIEIFLALQAAHGPNEGISSALAAAYHNLGFQTLADQVRRSVRSVRGNQWMFRSGHPADHPLRVRPELFERSETYPLFPILKEATSVRMDLTHSGWSDIFFLGMDFPEGARVLNVSIDLAVRDGSAGQPQPPVEAYVRVIDRPVLRLVSVDWAPAPILPPWPRYLILPAIIWDYSRRQSSLPALSHRGWKGPTNPWSSCWPTWSSRATAWKLSAGSTASPKARAWPFLPTCWPA
jgi:hypothetical protein